MNIALIGYGSMGKEIERIAAARKIKIKWQANARLDYIARYSDDLTVENN
jgi:pyrroline-5-carboxylate reductase